MAIAFAIQLPAQTTVTVGDENSALSNYGPVYSYYKNSFSEVVYLSSELQAGTIISISYQYAASEPLLDPTPTIYMAEVSRTAFSSSTDWETATMTQVYSGGSVTYSQGWVTISLTTPFEYSGTGNLVVAYNSQRDHYFGYRYFTHTSTTDSRMLMHNHDVNAVSGYNCTYSGTTYNQIPNTRFIILGEGEEYCFPATGLAAQNILSNSATLTWNISDASSTTFGLDYKLSSEEEWTTASTSITDTFYTLAGLNSLTRYDVRVYNICSSNNSEYTTTSFVTNPTEDECLSIPFSESFDDSENMTTWVTTASGSNRWYIGTAENCSGTDEEGNPIAGGSLYVSSDNGTSASYNNSATTNTYAYAYLSLQENTRYGLQFDWKGGNDGTYDYIKVYLVPADYELSSSEYPSDDYALSDRLAKQSDWTKKGIVISNEQAGFYKLVFLWHNDGSDGSAAGCVDNVSLFELACEPISSISVDWTNGEESVSANVNIVSENDDVTYMLEYKAAADAQWTELTGASPLNIPNLLHATQYIFRATPICSGSDYSVVSDLVTLYSPCLDAAIPYYQGFDEAFIEADGLSSNSSRPLCWLNINGASQYYYFSGQTTYSTLSGTGALNYSGVWGSSTTDATSDWMISPIFNLTGSEQISYNIRLDYEYPEFPKPIIDVMVCDVSETDVTTMADTSRFTLVRSINHSNLTTTYEEAVTALSAYTGAYRIAFAVRTPSQTFIMDSITLDLMPDCPPVYDLSAVATSESSIAVTYSTAGIGEAGVTIAYAEATGASTFDPESSATITVAQGDDLPAIISDLTPGATYYIAARQSCEGGTYSEAVTVVLPTTVVEFPYSQNFDDTEADNGYTLSGTGTNLWTVGTAANNTTDEEGILTENGRALYISSDNGTTANYNSSNTSNAVAKSPAIVFGEAGSFNLSFDYKVGGESSYDYLSVYLLPYGAEPSNSYRILSRAYNVSSWENFATTLSADYSNGIYQLVFEWQNDFTGGTQPGAIVDNIRIETLSCGSVSSVAATLVEPEDDEATITVDMTDNNAEGSGVTYVLRYKTSQDADYTIISDLSASDFPYSITDITYATEYTIAVASVCPDGVQTSFAQTSVAIPCATNTLPWAEHFNTDVLAGNPACWSSKSGLLPASGIVQTSSLNSGGLFNYNSSDQNFVANIFSPYFYSWFISPSIDLGDGSTTYGLSFSAMVRAFSGGNTQDAPDDRFVVLVSTDNGLSWDLANAHIYADGDADTENNYSDFFNVWTTKVIKLVDQNDEPLTGVVKIAFYGESTVSNGDNYFYLDDVSITEWSDCLHPYNVAATNVTSSTADITFAELGEATSWEYVLVEGENADLTSGTPVAFAEADLPLQITGLNSQTTYTLALRGSCADSYSSWSEAVTFTTWEAPTSLPYTTDFETAENNSLWHFIGREGNVNTWAIGSATFAGEQASGTSAYISNDNGTSYAATISWTRTYQYMWQDFDFGAGDDVYNLTFDWKSAGSLYEEHVYGGIAVLLQNQSDPIPTNTFSNQDNVVALLYGENAWTNAQIELPQVSGEKRLLFLAFGYFSDAEATAPAAIDNISITASTSACPAPQNVNVTDITDNSAEITWNGTASSYEVRLNGAAAETVTTTSKSFNNLTANTTYTAEVRAMCENNNSAWVSTTFTTLAEQGGVVPPTVATLAATGVTHNSAVLNGTIAAGSEAISAQGFMYKATAAADWTTVAATGETMTATINGLSAETAYQYKAFATTASGTVEGAVVNFTTLAAPATQPTVVTLEATEVTHETATLNGTVTTGSEAISAQGFMYKATAAADWTTVAATGETMSATINGLTAETAYEYKAFATTASGTVEGAVVNFTTLAAPATQPTVVTLDATEVTHEAATLNGTIAAGSEAISAQGFMYKATTAADWTTVAAEGTAITATINGLTPETEYEYKAFATTASGTVEGEVMTFTTLANSGLNSAEGAVATMTVYPNPASERAIVAVSGVENGAKIVVSDMQGRIILSDNMTSETYELSVANMTSGVYYIRVIGTTSTHTQKLIVE